ncbi:Ig-like domain-containing protein [Streptomyces sp. NBC_01304]|nr:Ig-like domain-containing protein [Streptomyces sp. NBC_01304]
MRRHTQPGRPGRSRHVRHAALAGTAVLALALTACGGGSGKSAAELKADKTAKISVNLQGDNAKAGEPVKITLADGKLSDVSVSDTKGGKLSGKISADGKTWTSERVTSPATQYKVQVKDDQSRTAEQSFGTEKAAKVNKLNMYPGKGTTVGVAQPISLVFDNPVKNKADIEKHLKVTTSNSTEGSWGWVEDYSGKDRIDWRPKEHWKSGTKVKLDADLNGINSGDGGGWFVRDYDTDFTIGKNQEFKVDLGTKQLSLVQDGKTVKTVPVAAGTPGGEKASWSGKMVLMAKEGTINMTSQSVGLGDAYDKMVDDSMRLTWSGMYMHAAPWNNGNFGVKNNSSGCVGMSKSDADSIYAQAQVGDPVEVTGPGSKGQAKLGNGYGEWNMTYAEWQAKSALHGQQSGQ